MSLRKVCLLLNTLRYTISLTWCSLKRKMYKSQQLKGLYYILQQGIKYIHVGLCLCLLAILKNIHALGDSLYVSIIFFSSLQKTKCWKLNNIFTVYVRKFIYKVLLKAIRSWDLIERYWLFLITSKVCLCLLTNLSIPQYILCCSPALF